jgi:hypothetical protein
MNEETCREILVTLFAVLCGLGDVREPFGLAVFRRSG